MAWMVALFRRRRMRDKIDEYLKLAEDHLHQVRTK